MKEDKPSPLQTTLTQYERDNSSLTESTIQQKSSTSDRIIQIPGDIRRALREYMETRTIYEEGVHRQCVVAPN